VRAVASTLGLDVGWDQTTSTVILTTVVPEAADAGKVIYEANGVRVTFTGFQQASEENDLLKGFYIKLKIENNSQKEVTVQSRDLSLNGIMCDSTIFSADVMPGKISNDKIWVINLEEAGVEYPITEAEFKLHIFDSESWDTISDSDPITVK
jgi:hypothetical protein